MDASNLVRSPIARRKEIWRTPSPSAKNPLPKDPRRQSHVIVVGVLVPALAAALVIVIASLPFTSTSRVPFEAPDFILLTDPEGYISLSELAGRPVVIHFIVLVCCSYSALEVGYMMEVEPLATARGIIFLSIVLESESNYYSPAEYREIMGFSWPLALDVEGHVQEAYGAQETSTYVIDSDGIVRHRDHETTSPATLASWIDGVA